MNLWHDNAHMNPAPPVIIMFFTSGSGSNFVLPFRTGASFHTPKSSKNLFVPLEAGTRDSEVSRKTLDCKGASSNSTCRSSVDAVLGGHDFQAIDDKEGVQDRAQIKRWWCNGQMYDCGGEIELRGNDDTKAVKI